MDVARGPFRVRTRRPGTSGPARTPPDRPLGVAATAQPRPHDTATTMRKAVPWP